MAKRSRGRPSVVLMIDTCVWLELAKDYSQRSLLSALEELIRMGQVSLLTPQLVIEEFGRNKERIVEESGRSIGSTLRRAKEMLTKLGEEKAKAEAIKQLNEIDQQSVNYRDAASEGVKRIEALFERSTQVRTSPDIKLAAADRAIKNKAPFHRQRNSMNDAILIEIFGYMQKGRGGHYVFVTHNIKDFSHIGVDEQKPHPETKLGDALNKFRPNERARQRPCGTSNSSSHLGSSREVRTSGGNQVWSYRAWMSALRWVVGDDWDMLDT